MRWFRANIRLGSRLALFALAVQILLSFAHVHLGDLTRAPGASVATVDGSGATPGSPLDKSNGTADPGCAICALIQLAATSAPAAPPVLALAIMPGHARPDAPVAVSLAASPHSPFQARAPPTV